MPQKKKQQHVGRNVALGIGAGLAVAGAAAGAWLYGTKEGVKARKKLEAWMLKAKAEVMEKIEKMPDVTEDAYHKAVKQVLLKYKKMKSVSTTKAVQLEKDMMKHWKNIQKQVQPKKTVKKKATKRKATKKKRSTKKRK